MFMDEKYKSIIYALVGMFLYVASDTITKLFLATTPVLDISLIRFAVGLPLIAFISPSIRGNRHAVGFTVVNTVNSMAGVYALTAGSLAGFAIASQMRPLFISGFGILFFGAFYSRKTLFLLIAAFALSLVIFSKEPDIHPWANIIFVVTVAFQSASFAAFGSQHSNQDVLGFTGLYNLVGFLTCLSLKFVLWPEQAFAFGTVCINTLNALIALTASLLVIVSYRTQYKVQASSINYLRLPISLALAATLFGETVTTATVIGSLGIVGIVYEIGRSKVDTSPRRLLRQRRERSEA